MSDPDWGVVQYELGLAAQSRSDGNRRAHLLAAVGHYRSAATAFTLAEHADEYAMVLQNLGSALSDLAQLDPLDPRHSAEAIEATREAVKAHAHRGSPVDWASAANNLGIILRDALHGPRAEQLEEALALHEAALGVFTAGGAGMAEALQLRNPGNPYWNDSLVRLAPFTRGSLQKGQERYTRVDFLRDQAWVLSDLAITLRARLRGDRAENLEAAIQANTSALRLFRELEDWTGAARVANNLGHAYMERVAGTAYENCRTSAKLYRAALELHRRGGSSPFEIAQTEQNFGVALVQFAERFPQIPREERSAAIEEGIALLRSSLRLRRRGELEYHWAMTSSMLALAFLHRIEGEREANLEESIALFDETFSVGALQAGAPVKWLEVKVNQGHAYAARIRGERQSNLEMARDCYRTALTGFEAAGLFEPTIGARLGLADTLAGLGRRAEALALLRSSIGQLESWRAASEWTESKRWWSVESSRFIDRLVALSWEDSPGEALEWSEFGRGRALADVQMAGKRRPSGVPEAEFDEYLRLQELQVDLERRLSADETRAPLLRRMQEVRAHLRSREQRFREADPRWSPAALPLKLPELLETASLCQVPILVVRVNPEATYVWLLRPGLGLVARRLDVPSRGGITRLLIGTEDSRESSWLGSYLMAQHDSSPEWLEGMEQRLGELWDGLVGALHDFVSEPANPAQLIVVASQTVGLFPLHAAWRKVDGATRFWCDDSAISYAPSIAALRAARASAVTAPARLLAVSDPTADLPWAAIEGRHVGKRSIGERTTLREESKARVLAELARRPDVIVFSCHGRWDFAAPWFGSGFQLADSMLTLRDLSAVDLTGCRLAILSACGTGMSDAADPADEFVGLPATFLARGAASVVGSLWSVDDVSTALIIARAFASTDHPAMRLHEAQQWIRNADLAQLSAAMEALQVDPALRDAAIADLAERGPRPLAHPFWWAALTCVGAP